GRFCHINGTLPGRKSGRTEVPYHTRENGAALRQDGGRCPCTPAADPAPPIRWAGDPADGHASVVAATGAGPFTPKRPIPPPGGLEGRGGAGGAAPTPCTLGIVGQAGRVIDVGGRIGRSASPPETGDGSGSSEAVCAAGRAGRRPRALPSDP